MELIIMKRIGIAWCLIFLFAAMHVLANDGDSQLKNFIYNDPKFIETVDMLNMDWHGNDDPATFYAYFL
jgi:hypothetical protein